MTAKLMHIVFLSQYYEPEIGAASERITGLARNLGRRGHRVTVITGLPNYPLGRLYPGYRKKLFTVEDAGDKVRVIRVWLHITPSGSAVARLLNYLSFMFSAILAALLFVRNADCLVATSGPIFAGLAGYVIAALKRIPFILDVRDIWPERIYAGTNMKRGPAIKALERLELFLYRKAAAIIAVTDGVKANITSKGVMQSKVTVITNGVDSELFNPAPPDLELSEELGIGRKSFVVIYAGTLGLLQDMEILLDCAGQVKEYDEIVFLVLGGGVKRDEFISKTERRGLGNVKVLPPVSPARLRDYINLADVGVNANTAHPHNRMALPVKMFTYMACAKPVVMANSPEIAELVEGNGIGRCVPPGDSAAFTEAIVGFYRDRESARTCGENALRLVQKSFTRERLAVRLESVLSSLAE